MVSPWNYLLQVGHVFSKGPQPNVYLICFSKSVLQGERGGENLCKIASHGEKVVSWIRNDTIVLFMFS